MPLSSDEYALGKQRTYWIFSLFILLMLFDFADRTVIAAILPYLRQEWGITATQAGIFSSILSTCMIILAIPAALIVDKWGRTKSAGLMAVVWSIASGVGAFTQNFGQLLASRALVGVGEAGYAPAAISWISTAFPKRRRQLAIGIFVSSASVGTALGLSGGGFIAEHFGWRHALGILAIPGFVLGVLLYKSKDFHFSVKSQIQNNAPQAKRVKFQKNLAVILRTPTLLVMYLTSATMAFTGAPMMFFLPSFIHESHGISIADSAYVVSLITVVGLFSKPLGGYIIDRLDQVNVNYKLVFSAFASLLGAIIMSSAFGLVEDLKFQVLLFCSAMLVGGSSVIVMIGVVQEIAPAESRALSQTCNLIVTHVLGLLPGPIITGLLVDSFGMRFAMAVMSLAGGLLICLLLFYAVRGYRADLIKAEERNKDLLVSIA